MDNNEMSSTFDILYNNITNNQAPGLNEAEKSVFLTKAQNMLVKEYFNVRTDGVGGGFDGSQQRQYDFSSLIRVESLFDLNSYKKNRIEDSEKLDRRSKVYLFPKDFFLAVNEILSDSKQQYSVLPLSYSEYLKLMLKPYNFPVKRGAWRLITNKKNCNYWKKYIEVDKKPTTSYYEFLSSWADSKRRLSVSISYDSLLDFPTTAEEAGIDNNIVRITKDTETSLGKPKENVVMCVSKESGDIYKVYITYNCSLAASQDDEEVVELLRKCFAYYNENYTSESDELYKVMTRVDGLYNMKAPDISEELFNNGLTFTTDIVQLPLAEVIGKFTGNAQYLLRYVKTLTPIILDDLYNYGEDFTIEGLQSPTECELPVECHQEIVERAVTLAKIAWQGGTATQAAAALRNKELL